MIRAVFFEGENGRGFEISGHAGGIAFIVASLLVSDDMLSPILGVVGCSCLWSILEIFEQKERVEKGWFPKNPKRKNEYK